MEIRFMSGMFIAVVLTAVTFVTNAASSYEFLSASNPLTFGCIVTSSSHGKTCNPFTGIAEWDISIACVTANHNTSHVSGVPGSSFVATDTFAFSSSFGISFCGLNNVNLIIADHDAAALDSNGTGPSVNRGQNPLG